MKVDGSGLLIFFFYLLIFTGIVVPSDGAHGFFSIKSLSFLAAFFLFFTHFIFYPRISTENQKVVLMAGAAFIFLALATLNGLEYPRLAFDQLKIFIITLFVPLATLYLINEGFINPHKLIKNIIYASFVYSLLKVSLAFLHFTHIINVTQIMEKFGIRFMSMAIYGNLARLQTSVDILTPFILFFALLNRPLKIDISKGFLWAFISLSWLAIFLSFSRYLILVGGLAHFLYWFTLDRKKLLVSLLGFCSLIFLGVSLIGPGRIYSVVERRFFSEHSGKSDETRSIQVEHLMEEFYKSPLFGNGMGAYAEGAIRDPTNKYSYEVQWVSFLMQFGIIGVLCILVPCALLSFELLSPPFSRVKLLLFLFFSLWLLSGFTNPFLISLTSGIAYTLFIAGSLCVPMSKNQSFLTKGQRDQKGII